MPKLKPLNADSLARQRDEIDIRLQELKKVVRRQKRRHKGAKKPTKQDVNDAVSIFMIGGSWPLVRTWFAWRHVTDTKVLDQALDDVRKKCPDDAVPVPSATGSGQAGASIFDPESNARVKKFLQEHNLHGWLETQNVDRGIAPGTAQVWKRRLADGVETPKLASTRKGQLQWLRRWRLRWDVKIGSVAQREQVPDDVARLKASGWKLIRPLFIRGEALGHYTCGAQGIRKSGRIMAAVLVPQTIFLSCTGPRKRHLFFHSG